MCLNLKSEFQLPRVTLFGKKVYKVIVESVRPEPDDNMYYYRTIVMGAEVHIGELVKSALIKTGDKVYTGLHSFKYEEDAWVDLAGWRRETETRGNRVRVVECRMPTFTIYYKGYSGEAAEQYASTKLRYVELINDDEY